MESHDRIPYERDTTHKKYHVWLKTTLLVNDSIKKTLVTLQHALFENTLTYLVFYRNLNGVAVCQSILGLVNSTMFQFISFKSLLLLAFVYDYATVSACSMRGIILGTYEHFSCKSITPPITKHPICCSFSKHNVPLGIGCKIRFERRFSELNLFLHQDPYS